MWDAAFIFVLRKLLQLRYSDTESILNTAQARFLSSFRRAGDLLKEITTIRIELASYRAFRVANELRHDMVVTDGVEEFSNFAEFAVRIDLLQVCLA